MSGSRFVAPPPDVVRLLREGSERTLTADEFAAYVDAPMSDDERAELLDLVRWFTTRYPTAGERLAYARRAYRRAKRWAPP